MPSAYASIRTLTWFPIDHPPSTSTPDQFLTPSGIPYRLVSPNFLAFIGREALAISNAIAAGRNNAPPLAVARAASDLFHELVAHTGLQPSSTIPRGYMPHSIDEAVGGVLAWATEGDPDDLTPRLAAGPSGPGPTGPPTRGTLPPPIAPSLAALARRRHPRYAYRSELLAWFVRHGPSLPDELVTLGKTATGHEASVIPRLFWERYVAKLVRLGPEHFIEDWSFTLRRVAPDGSVRKEKICRSLPDEECLRRLRAMFGESETTPRRAPSPAARATLQTSNR